MCRINAYTEGDKYWVDDKGRVIKLGESWHAHYVINNIEELMEKYPDLKDIRDKIDDIEEIKSEKEKLAALDDLGEGTYLGDLLVAHGWIAVGLDGKDSYARMLDNSFMELLFDVLFEKIERNGGKVDVSFLNGGHKMVYLEEVKANIDAANQDMSLSVLQELLDNGFDEVEWVGNEYECAQCQNLNGTKYSLADFISNLQHAAPIFEKSHVNCRCYLIVRNTITGEEQKVNFEGLVM
jgi:hypothetical protein